MSKGGMFQQGENAARILYVTCVVLQPHRQLTSKSTGQGNMDWTRQVLNIYDKVSRRVTNGVPNAKKLITRPIMVVTSPKSPGMDFSHPIFRFEIF